MTEYEKRKAELWRMANTPAIRHTLNVEFARHFAQWPPEGMKEAEIIKLILEKEFPEQ